MLVEPGGLAHLVVALGQARGVACRVGVEPGRESRSPLRSCRYAATAACRGTDGSIPASVANPAGAPSASPTATARLSRTTGVSAKRSNSSYHSTICTQSVWVTSAGVGVQCGDRRLSLVLAEPVAGEGGAQDVDPLNDEIAVPLAAILLGERHEAAVRAGAAGRRAWCSSMSASRP